MLIQRYILRAESNIHLTILSNLLATSHMVSEVVVFVKKKTTIAGPAFRKEYGPDMIMRKSKDFS